MLGLEVKVGLWAEYFLRLDDGIVGAILIGSECG